MVHFLSRYCCGDIDQRMNNSTAALTAERGESAASRTAIKDLHQRVALLRVEIGQLKQGKAEVEVALAAKPRKLFGKGGGSSGDDSSSTGRGRRRTRSASPLPHGTSPHLEPRQLGSQNSPPAVDGDYRKGGVAWGRTQGGVIGTEAQRLEPNSKGLFDRPRKERLDQGQQQQRHERHERRPRRSRSASPSPRRGGFSSPTGGSRAALQRLMAERDRLRHALTEAREAHRSDVAELQAALALSEDSHQYDHHAIHRSIVSTR